MKKLEKMGNKMLFNSKRGSTINTWILFLSISLLFGCASYSKVLINQEGQAATCVVSGEGIFGVAAAGDAYKSCLTGLHNLGFIEVEKAGSIGINFDFENPPRIIRVIDGSPANTSGLRFGDQVFKVDSSEVKTKYDAELLLFGNKGDKKLLSIKRDSVVLTFELSLGSVSNTNGRIKQPKTFKECDDIIDKVELYECRRFKKTEK